MSQLEMFERFPDYAKERTVRGYCVQCGREILDVKSRYVVHSDYQNKDGKCFQCAFPTKRSPKR